MNGVAGPDMWRSLLENAPARVTATKTSGSYSMAGAVMDPLPDGAKPLPQKIANDPAITAFAVELVHTPETYAPGSVTIRQFGDKTVAGRIEAHTWTHKAGKLVTGLNPPIRGASLYLVPDGSGFAGDRYNQMTRFDGDGRLPGFPGYVHSVSSVGYDYQSRSQIGGYAYNKKKGLNNP